LLKHSFGILFSLFSLFLGLKPASPLLTSVIGWEFRFFGTLLVSFILFNIFKLLKHDFGILISLFFSLFPLNPASPLLTSLIGWEFRFFDPPFGEFFPYISYLNG
jgi:hypothetical protein